MTKLLGHHHDRVVVSMTLMWCARELQCVSVNDAGGKPPPLKSQLGIYPCVATQTRWYATAAPASWASKIGSTAIWTYIPEPKDFYVELDPLLDNKVGWQLICSCSYANLAASAA